jgi:hypothetical protein
MASTANHSQVAGSRKLLEGLNLLGKTKVADSLIGVEQTALRGSLEVLDLAHPAGQWVPSGTNLGHHPSLPRVQSRRVSYGSASHAKDAALAADAKFAASGVEHGGGNFIRAISEVGLWASLCEASFRESAIVTAISPGP